MSECEVSHLPYNCGKCDKPFITIEENICSGCGEPRVQREVPKKHCLLCSSLISNAAQDCVLCEAPQDANKFKTTRKKQCINCKVVLIMSASYCYNCQAVQPSFSPCTGVSSDQSLRTNQECLSPLTDVAQITNDQEGKDKNEERKIQEIELRSKENELNQEDKSGKEHEDKEERIQEDKEGKETREEYKEKEGKNEEEDTEGRNDEVDKDKGSKKEMQQGEIEYNLVSYSREGGGELYEGGTLVDGNSFDKQKEKCSIILTDSTDQCEKRDQLKKQGIVGEINTTPQSTSQRKRKSGSPAENQSKKRLAEQESNSDISPSQVTRESPLFIECESDPESPPTDDTSDKSTTTVSHDDKKDIVDNSPGEQSPIVEEDIVHDKGKLEATISHDEITKNTVLSDDGKSAKGTNNPCIWKDPPKGLKGKQESMLTITFHAILVADLWEEFDSTSEVYIRCGSPELGNWNCDHGPMRIIKRTDGMMEVILEMKIGRHVVGNGFPYKYCVYTSKTICSYKGAQYEYIESTIRDVPADFANRYLKLKLASLSSHHQYDTVIYPNVHKVSVEEEKGFVKRFTDFAKGFLPWSSGSETQDTPSTGAVKLLSTMEHTRRLCLDFYIKEACDSLIKGVVVESPMNIVSTMSDIYKCLESPVIHNGRSQSSVTRIWKYQLKDDFKKLLFSIINDINIESIISHSDRRRLRIMVSVVMSCITKNGIEFSSEIDRDLKIYQSLALNPENGLCPSSDELIDFLSKSKDFKDLFLKSIRNYTNYVASINCSLSVPFNLVVLQRLLKGDCQPFETLEKNPKKIRWNLFKSYMSDSSLNKLTLRFKDLKNFPLFFTELQPLFQIDPSQVPSFICLCPVTEYEVLFKVLPPFYSLARLGYLYEQSFSIDLDVCLLLKSLHDSLNLCEGVSTEKFIEMQQVLDAVHYLIVNLRKVQNRRVESSPAIFVSQISLLLHVLSLVISSADEKSTDIVECHINAAMKLAQTEINSWISISIGGKMFGKQVSFRYGYLSREYYLVKLKDEFEIWRQVFSIVCPGNITSKWQDLVLLILKERLVKVTPQFKISILNYAESNTVNDMLLNVVVEDIRHCFEEYVLSGGQNSADSVRKLNESKYMTELLRGILKKKYLSGGPNIDDILEWKVWPVFMEIFLKHQKHSMSCLQINDREICNVAISVFTSVCTSVLDGSITIDILMKLKDKRNEVIALCDAISTALGVKGNPNKKHFPSSEFYKNVKDSLKTRINEYEGYVQRTEYLSICCQYLDNLLIQDIDVLKKELSMNVTDCKISSLYQINKESHVCHSFNCAASLFPILHKFITLLKTHPSNTFLMYWNQHVNQFCHTPLSFDTVVSHIWKPALEGSCSFLQSLKDRTISLKKVDELFKQYHYCDKIETEVAALERGISHCIGVSSNPAWIRPCVERMKEYHSLYGHINAAKAFLKLKETLKLSGDFTKVQRLAERFKVSVQDQSLQSIDDSLVKMGTFLNKISSDEKKIKCLELFSDCQDLVQWIKKETNDVHDLQQFVTIALATAACGEDDYTRDRLSNLRTVGSGFASLIYQLPEETSYYGLQKHCVSLWESLARDSKLPDKLYECNKQIEWFKSVKEFQGSVQKSSFSQMANIMEYGCYTIGSRADKISFKPSELIRMNLEKRDKALAQVKYTLNDLRDLESKLVLITGRDSEEKINVDCFLNVFSTVCHIADVLIQLKQHGHSKYTEWRLMFPCNLPHLVDELTSLLKEMNTDLEDWCKMVSEARNYYYPLNYYTTQQLLYLRKELCPFIDPYYQGNIKSDVMTLLQSISNHMTPDMVISQLRGQEEEESMETHSLSPHMTSSIKPFPSSNTLHFLTAPPPTCPQLEEKQLTDKQKSIMDNLIATYSFSPKLILLAFENTENSELEEEVEKWCNDHEEEESKFSESGSSEAGDNELILFEETADQEQEEVNTVNDSSCTLSAKIIIKPVTNVASVINENHPTVKQLVLAGYALDQCIEAVERYPNDISKAMEYLDIIEGNDDNGMEGLFPRQPSADSASFERQISDGTTSVTEIVIERGDYESVKSYLSLRQLAKLLIKLNNYCQNSITFQRELMKDLKRGEPNLIVTAPDEVLKTVLSLYMENKDLPLPTHEEVLVCSETTTTEEVTLLWKRAMKDPNYLRIFCLAHAERLSYQVCDRGLRVLTECSQGHDNYKLVIICSNEDQDKSHVVSKLHLYRRPFSQYIHTKHHFTDYLLNHFTHWPTTTSVPAASQVDPESSCVRIVSSDRSGMGKTLYIQRMKEQLETIISTSDRQSQTHCVVVPVHGPKVTCDSFVKSLKEYKGDLNQPILFHIDISPSVLNQIDSVLFSLLILKAISNSQGEIYRCHSAHLYAVEITVLKDEQIFVKRALNFLNLLPTMHCISPAIVLRTLRSNETIATNQRTMDEKEFKSMSFQCVYQYLRRHVTGAPLDRFSWRSGTVEGTPVECLTVLLNQCGVKTPSWSELKHFVEFLYTQLIACENSIFCDENIVGDVMSGLKTFVMRFMIRMSKDFATSSLKGEVNAENEEEEKRREDDLLFDYQIEERKQWEQSYHPYLFFNKDGMSITFVGFNVTRTGDIHDPITGTIIEQGAMTPQLFTGLQHNQVNLSENYQTWTKDTMILKIGMVMGLEWGIDPDPTYVLTVDNVIKIMAIHMRFRCNIPVVIMGETGCGKTRLIRYMCDIAARGCKQGGDQVKNMLIMKVHGGTTEKDVINRVKEAEKVSVKNRENHDIDTVLFFDEANTSDAIGLIKEVMCDRRLNGRPIAANVKFIAACNPYRKHTEVMISKLESAGLGFYVKATETQQKLGKVPLRQLVYRVLDLPPSMKPLVYDFGQLNNNTERDYIYQIVKDICKLIHDVQGQPAVIQSVAKVLAWSQYYMRERNDECSFVSLRDVERAMIVFGYFCQKKDLFTDSVASKAQLEVEKPVDNFITRALLMSISVCYHARLHERDDYERNVVQQFIAPLTVINRKQLSNEIRWCQDVLLDNMKLGPNIARNSALRENVFMMAICIELRIPLFLVGKPGSSKSLAKSIVDASMKGRTSEKSFMRELKEVHMFSYQCSQLSTPESVIEVFNTAKSFQKNQDVSNYVSVVVLDEVGLAEDSPNLPLKALHPLLEDGTEGADGSGQIISREQRVAFIGISNWALDPAKMNRGVMVTRGDPNQEELILSAKGICSNVDNDPVKEILDPYFKPLAKAYFQICKEQKSLNKSFFGLRDFYSLVKMLYWMCKYRKSIMQLTDAQLEHAIKRNFGGFGDINTYEIFKNHLKGLGQKPDLTHIKDIELKKHLHPDCTPLGLIRRSLQTKDLSWHGENRYLLFLTENYAALQVLKHYLYEEVGMRQSDDGRSDQRIEPYVLFGSSFPEDREYTQVCRNINQIKICMETGRNVILLNLDNLYESLYDLLNQYYLHSGGERYVDLGLQTHRVKCRVHNNFKLILIAEKSTVYEKFPTPLINRLEKHFVLTETILWDWQKLLLSHLEQWINDFTIINGDIKFTKQDAFIGYTNDTPASVIFQATQQIQKDANLDSRNLSNRNKAVLAFSKKTLLQMASPESLIRLKNTPLDKEMESLSHIYYIEQHHGSIVDFLSHHLKTTDSCGLLIQVTTHSHLLSPPELQQLEVQLNVDHIICYLLQDFDTEMDFTHKIEPAFSDKGVTLLIIQCDSGHMCGDLIACARYRIDDEREKARLTNATTTHVLFVINIPRQAQMMTAHCSSTFVGFQGSPWISVHIDDIRPPIECALTLDEALSAPISQLFYNGKFEEEVDEMELELNEEEKMEVNYNDVEEEEMEEEEGFINEPMEDSLQELEEGEILSTPSLSPHNTVIHHEEESVLKSLSLNEVSINAASNHMQCFRLYTCIQSAVASLVGTDESKQGTASLRVRLLLDLIPLKPKFPLDAHNFYGILVKHIKALLEEREARILDKEWVLKEALNGKKLQSGGTFQNVLTRRFDEVIIPIFAAIIHFIDHYSNLALLKQSNQYIRQLWLSIFRNEDLVQFSYQSYMMGKGIGYHELFMNHQYGGGQQVLVSTEERFQCQFPFFWLIKEVIESKWDRAKTTSGGRRHLVCKQLIDVLFDTPLTKLLSTVHEEYWKELYQFYLGDMLRISHNVLHHKNKEEYEILFKSLDAIITGPGFNHKSLLSYLSAVHVIYHEYEQDVMWFGQLTTHMPGILVQLIKNDHCNDQYMALPSLAVQVAISPDFLALPLVPGQRDYIPQRLVKLHMCQNAIESILTIASNSPHDQAKEMSQDVRLSWQRVRAVQLFIEHVVMKCGTDDKQFTELVPYAKRIDLKLERMSDFTKAKTVVNLQQILRVLDKDVSRKLKYNNDMQKRIREHCKSYFMEIVSSLCFGQATPPEPVLIKELLNVVFTEQEKTKDFTYSEKLQNDKVPVIRSFLLQLLLEHNTDEVKIHLRNYFSKAQQLIGNDRSLCLLCIQCLEDSIYKRHGQTSLQENIAYTCQLLNKGKELLVTNQSLLSLEYLEGISLLRYSMSVIAELIHNHYGLKMKLNTHDALLILNMAKDIVTDANLNTTETGPGVYLVKQIARQYGVTFLTNLVTSDPSLEWIIPYNLRQCDESQQTVSDPCVIYTGYTRLRTCLNDAVYGQDLNELQTTLQALPHNEAVSLVLAIYQVVAGSAVYTSESKKITDETREKLLVTLRKCTTLSRQHQWIIQHLIQSTYCGRLEHMLLCPEMNPQNRLFIDFVIHVSAIVHYNEGNNLLKPLLQMINSPQELTNMFLPTMPEDSLPIARMALGGCFYECSRGHPYYVSECGRPVQNFICPVCQSPIGGTNHNLTSTNRDARTNDTTETGYALGMPNQRESIPSSERSLSPSFSAIIRALMHASLLWASCTNEHATEGLMTLIKSQVRPRDLSNFFWQHLKHDLSMLSHALVKSIDDVCLILHLLLKDITAIQVPPLSSNVSLSSRENRQEWERIFSLTYIQPLLANLSMRLQEAHLSQLNDKREDHDRLFYTIYERTAFAPDTIVPHLWIYRPRISLQHLLQALVPSKDTYPILHEFLKEEVLLRATMYLPALIKLQQHMYELSHRKLDKKEVLQLTIGDYIKTLKDQRTINSVNKKTQFQDRLNSVKCAWNLVKERLKDYSRIPVPPALIKTVVWDENTSLSCLVPTLTEEGVCTVALVDLLVGVHNEFVEKCRSQLKRKQKKDFQWKKHKVPLSQIQYCHLLDYEDQLLSIVLSHCHYSLEHGKGQNISYDLPALEKHIVDRFIHGKPLIQLEIPQVVYRKDVYTAEAFANIRMNVSPQVKLNTKQQNGIVMELGSMQRLRECLDVVEIVIGFLSSGKSSAKMELKIYIKKILKMENRLISKKAMEYCTLGHILSLWETLSIQIAKTLTISQQEPFDSFKEHFFEPLQKDVLTQLRKFLKGIDIPYFLYLLFEFIEINVRHRQENEINWPLKDTLIAHLENNDMEKDLPKDFYHKFPNDINVSQSIATWKAIVIYQQQHDNEIR